MKNVPAKALLGLCLLAGFAAAARAQSEAAERDRAWDELMALTERDLSELKSSSEKLGELAEKLVPGRRKNAFGQYPRFFWNLAGPGAEPRMVLVDFQYGVVLPGQSVHYLYFFHERRRLVTTTALPTGWRQVNQGVKLYRREDLGHHVLEISTVGMGLTGVRATRQFYALRPDGAVLVRLEGAGGKLMVNSYGCPYPMVGPPVPRRSAAEWATALGSADAAEVLGALTWLGGRRETVASMEEELAYYKRVAGDNPHIEGVEELATLGSCPGAAEDVKTFAAVVAREDVRRALRELKDSPTAWVAEAARAAGEAAEDEKWR